MAGLAVSIPATAQDTSRRQSVEIVSAFKPVLKNAVKQNFTATPPAPDAGPGKLQYSIPVQQLYFNLQPLAFKPLALQIDSGGKAHNSNYVKLGYGNYRTPLAEAGFSIGDGKNTNFNLLASHISQRGDLRVQRYSRTDINAHINSRLNKQEVYGKAGYWQQTNYLYGPDPAFLNTKDDSLRKPYQNFTLHAGVRNAMVTPFGASYNPNLTISVFGDGRSNETNARLDVPVELRIGTSYSVHLQAGTDLTTYTPTGATTYTNHVHYVNPAVAVKNERFRFRAGIRPTWDNGPVRVLPDLLLDVPLQDEQLIFTAGWVGQVRKNNYEYLAKENPWIYQPLEQFNTRITQAYAGLRGTVATSFNYRFQFGVTEFLGLPLFENSQQPALFRIRRESRLQTFHSQAELGYVLQDKLQATAKLDWYNIFRQQDESRAWHFIPLRLTGGLNWQPIKQLQVRSDVFAWQGPVVLLNGGGTQRLPAVFDLNASLAYQITPLVGAWMQLNNIFNNTYERWNNYPVLGFQIIAGIKLTFDQKL
ncbi:MAG TPA: hypothetical protein PKA69_10590 [Lacibacter sp.]|nr:hypothetical protein [Lacibacter sp.]